MNETLKLFEQKVADTYYEIDKSPLREMQKKMYECAARCCEQDASHDYVQSCVDKCTAPYQTASKYVQNEFEDFQRRAERCIHVCSDESKNLMQKNKLSEPDDKVKADFEQCAISCVTRHIGMLPTLIFKVRDTLNKHNV